MWGTTKSMTKTLGPMVKQCILNQTKGYCLIFYLLHFEIVLGNIGSIKLKHPQVHFFKVENLRQSWKTYVTTWGLK